jgi:hypothetical protein
LRHLLYSIQYNLFIHQDLVYKKSIYTTISVGSG